MICCAWLKINLEECNTMDAAHMQYYISRRSDPRSWKFVAWVASVKERSQYFSLTPQEMSETLTSAWQKPG